MADIKSINGNPIVLDASGIGDDTIPDSKLVQTGGVLEAHTDLEASVLPQLVTQEFVWESGFIDSSGNNSANSYRHRTASIMSYDFDLEIAVDDGYTAWICFYDSSGTFKFRSSAFSRYAVPAGARFRVAVMSANDASADGYRHVKFSTVGYIAYIRSQQAPETWSAEFLTTLINGQVSSTGVVTIGSSYNYRVTMYDTFEVVEPCLAVIAEGYSADFALYDESDTFISRTQFLTGTYTLQAGWYRITVSSDSAAAGVVSDVVEFSRAIAFEGISSVQGGAQTESFNYGVKYPRSFDVVDLFDYFTTFAITAGKIEENRDVLYQYGVKSYMLLNSASANCNVTIRMSEPVPFYQVQEFMLAMYIPDASNVSRLRFGNTTVGWTKYFNGPFVDGWNIIRLSTNGTGMGESATIDRLQFIVYLTDTSTETPVYLCSCLMVKPPHASIIFVDDGPYASFYDYAYPRLTAIGCPVTWAIECASLPEVRSGSRSLITLDELTALEDDGISEFSWHGYNGELTANLNARETADYNLKCIRFLARRGDLNGKVFRAVWPGNTAPNYELAIEDLDACATYNGAADIVLYPYPDKYNIPRYSLQSRDSAWIDDRLDVLKKTHQTAYIYTHGIIDSTSFDPAAQDMRLDLLEHLIDGMTDGVDEGWLKLTTYNRLEREYWGAE